MLTQRFTRARSPSNTCLERLKLKCVGRRRRDCELERPGLARRKRAGHDEERGPGLARLQGACHLASVVGHERRLREHAGAGRDDGALATAREHIESDHAVERAAAAVAAARRQSDACRQLGARLERQKELGILPASRADPTRIRFRCSALHSWRCMLTASGRPAGLALRLTCRLARRQAGRLSSDGGQVAACGHGAQHIRRQQPHEWDSRILPLCSALEPVQMQIAASASRAPGAGLDDCPGVGKRRKLERHRADEPVHAGRSLSRPDATCQGLTGRVQGRGPRTDRQAEGQARLFGFHSRGPAGHTVHTSLGSSDCCSFCIPVFAHFSAPENSAC